MAFRFNYATGKFEQLVSAKDPKDTNGDGVVNGFDSVTSTTGTTSPPRTTTTSSTVPRTTTTSTMAPTTTTVPRSTTTMPPSTTTMAPTTTVPRTTTTSTVAPTTTLRPTTTTMAPTTTSTAPPRTTTTSTMTPTTSTTVAPKTTVTPTTVPTPPSTTTTTVPAPVVPVTPVAPTVPVVPPVDLGPIPYDDKAMQKLLDDYKKALEQATNEGFDPELFTAPFLAAIKAAADENAAWAQDNRTIKFNERERLLKEAKEAKDAAAKAAASSGKSSGVSAAETAKAKAKAELDKEKRDNEFTIGRDNRAEQFRIDAENRANARTDALAEVARIRGYDGGMAAADMLESRSGQRTIAALQAVKDLYDPLDEKTAGELATQLSQIATNFANARGQVQVAGTDFLENFAKTLAYTQVPITQFSAGQNPLMEALRQQGASTVEVQNAMDLAAATSQSTSDLAKWAASQLNVTQQNMDSAAMNASRGATQTALQGLSSREPEVQANMTMKYNDLMATLMRERAAANASANQAGYAGQDAADAMRANTMANYGTPAPVTDKVPDKVVEPIVDPDAPIMPTLSEKEKNTAIQLENLNKNSGLNAQELLDQLNERRGY